MLKKISNKHLSLFGILLIFSLLIISGFILSFFIQKKIVSKTDNTQIQKLNSAADILFEKYADRKKRIISSQRMILFFFEAAGELTADTLNSTEITATDKDGNYQKKFVFPSLSFNSVKRLSLNNIAEKITYINNTFVEVWQKSGSEFVRISSTKPNARKKYIFITDDESPANKILKGEDVIIETRSTSDLITRKSFPLYNEGEITVFITLESNENLLPAIGKIFKNELIVFDKNSKIIFGGNKNNLPEGIKISEMPPVEYKDIFIKKLNEGSLFYKYIPEFSVYLGFYVPKSEINQNFKAVKYLLFTFIIIIFSIFVVLFLYYDFEMRKKHYKLLQSIKKTVPEINKSRKKNKTLSFFQEYFSELKTIISETAKGNYNVKVCDDFKEDALIKNIELIRNKFIKIKKAEEERKKELILKTEFDKTASEISEILQYSADVTDLSSKIVKKISEFTGAEQVAMFIAEEDFQHNKKLKMAASYAYSKNRTTNRTIDTDEGLTGRAFLEKQSIFLTEIPENYTFIESGFGFQRPNCILLVPLIFNNEVQAIIELGSIEIIKKEYIKFIEDTGENIASTIANLKHSRQTEILLKQTKKQAEEIENQRKTLEEKINTHRKQNRNLDKQILQLIEIIDSIKSVSYLIEYDLKGSVMDVSSKVTGIFDAGKKDFISKLHKDIVLTDNYDEKYKMFWENLLNKKTVNIEETIQIGSRKVTFKQTYVPIKNVRRKIYRILSIGTVKE